MAKLLGVIFFMLGLGLIFSGCIYSDPYFAQKEYISQPYQVNSDLSEAYSNAGWTCLLGQLYKESFGKSSAIDFAQNYFNQAWENNHDNYNAFWGWGIIRIIQSQSTSNSAKTKQYLQESIKYLQYALDMTSLPAEERQNLMMDLANAYNEFGIFYTKSGKSEYSQKEFERAEVILNHLCQINPDNANLYRLLSFNAYLLENYKQAQIYRKNAEDKKIVFTREYIKNLEEKFEGEK